MGKQKKTESLAEAMTRLSANNAPTQEAVNRLIAQTAQANNALHASTATQEAVNRLIAQTAQANNALPASTATQEAVNRLIAQTAQANNALPASTATQEAVNRLIAQTAHVLSAPRTADKPIRSSKELGILVCNARKRMRLNQQAFADLAGVGRRFVSELETGKPTLEFDKVLRTCSAAGIDLTPSLRGTR